MKKSEKDDPQNERFESINNQNNFITENDNDKTAKKKQKFSFKKSDSTRNHHYN
jgi:hypothetical protein